MATTTMTSTSTDKPGNPWAYYSSITSLDNYSSVHRCARDAYAAIMSGSDAIEAQNCDSHQDPGVFGLCLCNTYASHLESTIAKVVPVWGCSTNVENEASTAVSLFSDFCTSALKAAATESGGGASATLTGLPAAGVAFFTPTSTSSSSSPPNETSDSPSGIGGSSSGLSSGAIAGIAIGSAIGAITLLTFIGNLIKKRSSKPDLISHPDWSGPGTSGGPPAPTHSQSQMSQPSQMYPPPQMNQYGQMYPPNHMNQYGPPYQPNQMYPQGQMANPGSPATASTRPTSIFSQVPARDQRTGASPSQGRHSPDGSVRTGTVANSVVQDWLRSQRGEGSVSGHVDQRYRQ